MRLGIGFTRAFIPSGSTLGTSPVEHKGQRLGVNRLDSLNFELCSQDRLATISKYLSVSFSVFIVILGPQMPAQKKLGNHHWVDFNYIVAEMKAKPDPKAQSYYPVWLRVVHGSLFLDPTRPAETLTRPDPTRDCRQKV